MNLKFLKNRANSVLSYSILA